jgi:adenylate cyclase
MQGERQTGGESSDACHLVTWLGVQALLMLLACPCAAGTPAGLVDRPSTEKKAIAVLWFENRTADPEAAHWRYSITRLLMEELDQVKVVRLRTANALEYAFEQADAGAGSEVSVAKAREMGEFIEAQRVIWGSYRREDDQWHARVAVLNTATGELSDALTASAADWYALRDRLVEQILAELKIAPSETEREKMGHRRTASAVAFEWLSKARALQQNHAPFPEQEQCARQAVAADPQFAYAHAALAAVLGSQGKFDEAEATSSP